MRGLIEQLLKFGVVGAAATLIDFAVMIALTELAGLDPVISAGISFTVSVVTLWEAASVMRTACSQASEPLAQVT